MKKASAYFLLLSFLFGCANRHTKQQENFSHYSLKERSGQRASDSLVQNYRQKLASEMSRVIASSTDVLTRDNSQSTLGNFACDALKFSGEKDFKTGIDLVIANRGGFRNNLPKGEITVGNIFELMPFDNQMVLVKVSGQKLLSGLNAIISKRHAYYGMKLVLKKDSFLDVQVNGRPVDRGAIYTIVTSDYLANGGDGFSFLSEPVEIRTSTLMIREAIINYCLNLSNNNKPITPYTDERLRETK